MAHRATICILVSVLWIGGAVPAAAAPIQLAAHRAVYDISLKSANDRSGITGASGRMVVEVTGSECEGWSIGFRIVNQFTLSAGRSRTVDSRSSSWEAGDGSSMRYAQRQYVDTRLEEETLVSADAGKGGGEGSGKTSKPKEEVFKLPARIVFPVAHQKHLIEQARLGETRDESLVYDGSEGSKTLLAITFIGLRSEQPLPDSVKGDAASALKSVPSWPVTLSYYPSGPGAGEETPAHQISFRMYDNGIAGDLVMNYSEFSLAGKLASVDILKQPTCP
ncbi:MAG: DUF1849 family protein [Parvibaculaceae bacterium]